MRRTVTIIAGCCLVALGLVWLLYSYDLLHIKFPWIYIRKVWPIFIILAGFYVIINNIYWRHKIKIITFTLFIIWFVSLMQTCMGNS